MENTKLNIFDRLSNAYNSFRGISSKELSNNSYNWTDGSWASAFPYYGYNQEKYQEDYRSFAYSCINLRAEKIMQSETLLYKKQTQNDKPILVHPFLDLMNKTNRYGQTFNDIEFLVSCSLDLMGNALIYYTKNIFGMPMEWIYIPFNRVTVMYNTDYTLIEKYIYNEGTKSVTYYPDEIIHFKLPNPYNPLFGKATASACKIALNIDWLQSVSQSNFYKNDTRLGMVMMTEKVLSDTSYNRLKEQIIEQKSGSQNSGKHMILENGLSAQPYQATPKEADYVESRNKLKDEICGIFRVPKSILGFADDVNRANSETALINFVNNTIKPYSLNIVNPLQTFVRQNYDERLFLTLDFKLAEPEEVQLRRDDMELRNGAITRNEYRERRGIDKSTEPIADELIINGKTITDQNTQEQDSNSNNQNNDNGNK